MSDLKFKVGDWVKMINSYNCYDREIGEVGKVIGINSDGYFHPYDVKFGTADRDGDFQLYIEECNLELSEAHMDKPKSFKNVEVIKESTNCGCYYCLKIFDKNEIKKWYDNKQTAVCPYCGVDSVIPNTNKEELEKLYEVWF